MCMGFVIADETRFVRVVFARCVTRREFGVVRFRERTEPNALAGPKGAKGDRRRDTKDRWSSRDLGMTRASRVCARRVPVEVCVGGESTTKLSRLAAEKRVNEGTKMFGEWRT